MGTHVNVLSVGILCLVLGFFCPGNAQQRRGTLQISSILNAPFLMPAAEPASSYPNDKYEGYTKDLAEEVSRRLGFNYQFRIEKDQTYGRKQENGTWTGLIGDLVSYSGIGTPMVIADLSVTRGRAEVVDFSIPFMQVQLAILVKDPKAKEPVSSGKEEAAEAENEEAELDEDEDDTDYLIWLRPFSTWLWILFSLTAIFLVFLLFFLEKTVEKQKTVVTRGAEPPPPEKLFHNFSARVFGTPKSVGAKFLQITLWVFITVFVSAYTANFAADQVVDLINDSNRKDYPVDNVQELVDQDKIKYGILTSGSTHAYFSSSKNPLIHRMFEAITESNSGVHSYERGIAKVRKSKGRFAFILESPAAKYYSTKKPCDLDVLPELFGPKKGFAVALQKGSPLLGSVNLVILELIDSGFLNDLEDKWFKDSSECEQDDQTVQIHVDEENDPLTLESMVGLFGLLGLAAVIVVVIALVEISLIPKYQK